MLAFQYGSDKIPPVDVERSYLSVFTEEMWPAPTLAATQTYTSPISGPTGVKMTGPYDWQPPEYWSDPQGATDARGGASGFNTETSPGASPMVMQSQMRTVAPTALWNESTASPTDDWLYHCDTGQQDCLHGFSVALTARLGAPISAADYLQKAQLMAYEAHRAMFEAFSRSKYKNATGVIQWMLNNPWPS